MECAEKPNPNNLGCFFDYKSIDDFLLQDFDDYCDEHDSLFINEDKYRTSTIKGSGEEDQRATHNIIKHKDEMVMKRKVVGHNKISFRTKSEIDVMDDGFKWRKYGKKAVKNNPNPRNYFKCSSGECRVKKRIERDKEDYNYVITTYDGVHNHQSPCLDINTTTTYNNNHFISFQSPPNSSSSS